MERRKLIIDTDCGSDDAIAIAMALNDERYEILMFSTVSGNVRARQACYNLLTTLKLCDTYYPPVYEGSNEMLKRDFVGAEDTHGKDGMGDLGLVDYSLKITEGNGIDMILQTLKENEAGSIDIIALGPLTNIALAIRKDPETMRKARRVVSMAVTFKAGGNVTDYAEFNVWQDAEAFKEVIDFGFRNLMFVAWDASLGEAAFKADEIEKLRNSSALGEFCVDSNICLLELNRARFHEDILDLADPAAMCAALYPECIEECENYHLDVDLSETERYGFVEIDYDHQKNEGPSAFICSKLKADVYKRYLYYHLKAE
ncbi:MAG: nucleoside hydrolase [Erysipelotrichaceae bacterium]|nr:nucleoside hydrolase [Erysipelotrichaceae bacterium]